MTSFAEILRSQVSHFSYEQLVEAISTTVPKPTAAQAFSALHKQSLKASSVHMTPDRIARLMAAIGNTYSPKSVLDLACGTGQLLHYCTYASELVGVDIDPQAITLARYIQPTINFIVADALQLEPIHKFDLVISNIPFGIRTHQGAPLEKLLIEKALTLLHDDGALIMLVPPNLLWARLYETLRKVILSNYALDMIVTLPSGTLEYTSISSSILVVRKGRAKQTVYLADYNQNIKQIVTNFKTGRGDFQVPISEIVDRWDRHYYLPQYTQYEEHLDTQYTRTLEDISDIIGGYLFGRDERQETGDFLILTPRHFQQSVLQLWSDNRTKYTNKIENNRFQRAVLYPGDIVVSLISNFGFYVYQPEDPPAVADQNTAIIRSNENEYIQTYLQTSVGRSAFLNQVQRMAIGDSVRRLAISNLKKFRIPVLPLADPNSLSDEKLGKSSENDLQELREQLASSKQQVTELQKALKLQLRLREAAASYQVMGIGSGVIINDSELLLRFIDDRFKSIETVLQTIQQTTSQILALVRDAQTQIQQIKQTPREDEEKLLRIYARLDEISATISDNRRTIEEYVVIVQRWLEHWDRLDEASKKFLTSAEFLFDEIHKIGDDDYSPFIIQYCRAIENEILKKLFEAYHCDFYNRYSQVEAEQALTDDLSSGKTGTFAKAVKKNDMTYTLGQMSFILQMVKPGGRTIKKSFLLQDFRSFALSYFESHILEYDYLDRINLISEDYRNKAAHPYLLGVEKARSCQILIRESLNIFLAGYLGIVNKGI